MDVHRIGRSVLPLTVACLLMALSATASMAQEANGQVIQGTLGRAQLDLPGITRIEVGTFGGGLSVLERRRPDVTPLAARFRMQRRSGILMGLAAIAGSAIVIERFADTGRSPLELGDPEANIAIGALGAMAFSVIQLEASGRTLRRLAAGFRGDGSYGSR